MENTATGKVVAGDVSANTVKIYYLPDTTGTKTPDAYEATVIYQISGGTWNGETDEAKKGADRTVYVPMSTWDETNQKWVPKTGEVKPTNIPDGTHNTDNTNPGTWGRGEVSGKPNDATATDPANQKLEAEKVYIFKLTFGPLGTEIVIPNGEGTVEASSRTWVYDGRPHGVTATVTNAPDNANYKLYYSTDGGKTWSEDAPSVTNVADNTTVNVEARDASANNYKALEASYTLTITRRPLTIRTPSGSKVYDGTALTGGAPAIEGLVSGETITVTATGSQTEVGSSPNGLSAITWETAKEGNYDVTRILGTLTITAQPGGDPPIIIPPTFDFTPTGPTGTTITDDDTPLAAPGLNSTDHFDYIKGYEDGTVRPEAAITRGEVATIFFRLMTNEFRTANWATENSFSDVQSGDWYNNAISTCVKAGILTGYPDGTFRPKQAITRAEFATIAASFASEEVPAGGMFKDIEGHWAEKSIERAAAAGWIKGSNGNFRPNDQIIRAEVITTINRMLDRIPDADHMLPDMKTFVDNTPDMWWYADVQEATNSHDYERAEDGVTGIWTALLPEQDWTALEKEWATAADANVADVMNNLEVEGKPEEEGEGEPEPTED